MEWVLLAVGVLGGAGIGGPAVAYFDRRQQRTQAADERDHASAEAREERQHASAEARAEREHASREARSLRLWAFRRETYAAASSYLERQSAWLQRTDPVIGPQPEPPSLEPDDDYLEVAARVAIGCSEPVRRMMQAAVDRHAAFFSARRGWQLEQEGNMPQSRAGQASARMQMDARRQEALAAIRAAQTAMRDELERL